MTFFMRQRDIYMQEYLNTFWFLILCSGIIIVSCNDQSSTELTTDIDPETQAQFVRYDNHIDALNSSNYTQEWERLKSDYPAFTDVYTHQILALPNDTTIIREEVIRMISDSGYLKLSDDVSKVFADFDKLKPEINQTLENYTKLFGLKDTPSVYTYISGFVYQGFVFDDVNKEGVGIGLDMFLGSDFPYEKIDPTNPSFSTYLTRAYNKEHISKKIAEVLIEDKMTPPKQSDFLSLMIWGGKKLYLMDQVLTFKPNHIVIEYTPEQYEWCQNNESQIWDLFFDKNLFYETDLKKFNKLIAPAPTSPGMPPESPGRTANYMGWQIVKAFMKRNPNTTLQELIDIDNPQHILDQSRFKPKR